MSTVYLGEPGNIDCPVDSAGGKNIASSSNATPIEITTSAAHGLTEGEEVLIVRHETNYKANGIFIVHVTSTTSFTILFRDGTDTVGVAVGGATGKMLPRRIDPQMYVLDDLADDLDASTLNPITEDHADKIQYLAGRIGQYHLANAGTGRTQVDMDTVNPAAGWLSGTAAGGSWTAHSGADLSVFAPTSFQGDENLAACPNDVLEAILECNVKVTGASDVGFGLSVSVADYGVAHSYSAPEQRVAIVEAGGYAALTLRVFKDVGTSDWARKFDARLFSRKRAAGGSSTFELFGDRAWHWKVWRRRQL
jgi:hypothetical protein